MSLIKQNISTLGAVFGCVIALLALWLYSLNMASYPSLSYFGHFKPIGGDFFQFWAAAKLTVNGMAEGAYQAQLITSAIYDVFKPEAGYLFTPLYYPAHYLLLIAPLGLLPFFPALIAFFTFTLTVFMTGVWLWTRSIKITLLMLCFSAIWLNLVTGQNGLLTAGLWLIALRFLTQRPAIAGICFALLTIKPHLGIFIPIALIAGGHWRCFKYSLFGWLGLTALSMAAFGAITLFYSLFSTLSASTILATQTKLLLRIPSFFSFSRLSEMDAALLSFTPLNITPHGLSLILQLLLIVLLAVLVARVWRKSKNHLLNCAVLASATLLGVPFLYDYDTALLIVPILALGLEAQRTGWKNYEFALLPTAMIWPMAINHLPYKFFAQIGFILPLLLLLASLNRLKDEKKSKNLTVARPAQDRLNKAV
jgi:hypothetical protein